MPGLESLTDSIWEEVAGHLSQKDIFILSRVNSFLFHLVRSSPSLYACLIMHSSCSHLAFHHLLTYDSSSLTFELAEQLLLKGAVLPKYLIEVIYSTHSQKPLPIGTLEFIVATGYKEYQDSLALTDSEGDTAKVSLKVVANDDRVEFMAALFDDPISIKKLETIVRRHGYVPALSPPTSDPQWELLWDGISNLVAVDISLGLFITKHAGVSFDTANAHVMRRLLHKESTDLDYLKELVEAGFLLNQNAVVSSLAWYELPIKGDTMCSAMLEILPREDIEHYLVATLQTLFRENTRAAIRNVDFLIDRFNAPDDLVSQALLVDTFALDEESNPGDSLKTVESFMCTVFGRVHGGMNDVIWPAIVSRYGADHAFVEACLIDFIIGGYLPVMIPKETLLSSPTLTSPTMDDTFSPRTQRQFSFFSALTGSSSQGTGLAELDETADLATSDSIHAIIGLGVPFRPTVFIHLLRVIKVYRQVPPRFVEYFSFLEKHLISAPNDAESWLPVLQATLNSTEWRRYLPASDHKPLTVLPEQLESPDSLASPSSAGTTQSTTPNIAFLGIPSVYAKGFLSSIQETVKRIDFLDHDMRRFMSNLACLVDTLLEKITQKSEETELILKSPKEITAAQKLPEVKEMARLKQGMSLRTESKKIVLPFSEWRDEIRRSNKHGRMTSFSASSPVLPSLASLASSFQDSSLNEIRPQDQNSSPNASPVSWVKSWFR